MSCCSSVFEVIWNILGVACLYMPYLSTVFFAVLLGIFAFNNPDPAECWFVEGMEVGTASRETAMEYAKLEGIEVSEIKNAHNQFVTWFTWGFINFAFMFTFDLIHRILHLCYGCRTAWLHTIMIVLGTLSGFAWLCLGLHLRWGPIGEACTGEALPINSDLLPKKEFIQYRDEFADEHGLQVLSGNVMQAWLMISASAISLVLMAIIVSHSMDVVEFLNYKLERY